MVFRSLFDGINTYTLTLVTGAIILAVFYVTRRADQPWPGVPVLTVTPDGKTGTAASRLAWMQDSLSVIAKGCKDFPGCFQVYTSTGYKIIVPNRFADELRSDPHLSFNEFFTDDLFVKYPGFDGFAVGLQDGQYLQEIVRMRLTQSLGLVTDDLVEESDLTMHDTFGESSEWRIRTIKEDLRDVVARLSSRVFLGSELCRNRKWLQISKSYAVDCFDAAREMKKRSGLFLPLRYWFIPECKRLRQEVRDARSLIMAEVEMRRKRAEIALQNGQKPPKTADAIGWMVEMQKGRVVDFVAMQLSLSIAAIHTTSELISQSVMRLCDEPELQNILRREITEVLTKDGWSKVSLGKLKLVDSFLKEVQRTNIVSITSMNRKVKKSITLSDGTLLPQGSRITVPNNKTHDAAVYDDPSKFDPARFMRKRNEPGGETKHQFVTPSSEHLAFGYGSHACPGRFFASNELKILLCFLLMKYDFRNVPDEKRLDTIRFETMVMSNPQLKVQLRRRKEEFDLLSPAGGEA